MTYPHFMTPGYDPYRDSQIEPIQEEVEEPPMNYILTPKRSE